MRVRRVLGGAVAGAALLLGGIAVPAAQAGTADASAVTCGNAYWPHNPNDGRLGSVRKTGGAAAHTGPYGDCTTVGIVADGTTVRYDCYVVNDYGNTWTWVRTQGGSSLGWVYDAYLSGNGASEPC
ncbi:hypothetical protein ACGFRB_25005 [Streptomyces sp. NPDC048718]|uniref:hypothetical protein n=1 Tax=Streptomyces sp. NPDC048718 TaxID=3365587 RepID=UPI00371F73E0